MLTLGINYSATHDSSAAIVQDGKVLFAIAEERLSKIKHDGQFPKLAIQACLDHAGVSMEDVTEVVSGWPRLNERLRMILFSQLKGHVPVPLKTAFGNYLRKRLTFSSYIDHNLKAFDGGDKVKIRYLEHHYAHAVSAFAMSGFDDSLVLVVDGHGAWESSSLWRGRNGKLERLKVWAWPNSLGLFYASFTGFLGFKKYADEWKIMGLAPYGTPGKIDLTPFISYGDGSYTVDAKKLFGPKGGPEYSIIESFLGPKRDKDDPEISQHYKDVAWAVQHHCEEAECEMVRHADEVHGCRNLCIAGGVGLNSKANGLIMQRKLVDKIFIQPAAGDDGVALGAALAPSFEAGMTAKPQIKSYFGPEYSDEEIIDALEKYKISFVKSKNVAKDTAKILANGDLVGWFQGREEFGPRALGDRSIIADPRSTVNRDKVNLAVKFREQWRPFAPSVLREECDELFENFVDSPFMILTFPASAKGKEKIPAAVHVDGSARVQSVTKAQNPKYYEMIKEFGKISGVSAVLNTSFNLKGEVIVNSPFDAIRTFYTSGLDALVLGDFIVRK